MEVIHVQVCISDHFSTALSIAEYNILGDLLAFLIHSPADFYDTWQNDLCQPGNESTTFWHRSGRHLDLHPDQSGNLYLNPSSLLVEATKVQRVR